MKEESIKHWQPVIEQWRGSGLNKTEFCRRNDVDPTLFKYYSVKLHAYSRARKNVPVGGTGGAASFAEVVCKENTPELTSGAAGKPLILRLDCGGSVELSSGFDAETLKRVLRIAREV